MKSTFMMKSLKLIIKVKLIINLNSRHGLAKNLEFIIISNSAITNYGIVLILIVKRNKISLKICLMILKKQTYKRKNINYKEIKI